MFFPYQALAIRELSKNMFQVFDVRFHIQRFNSKCEMCVSASYLESLIACNFRYFLYDHFSDIVIQVSYVLLYVKQRLFPPYYSLFIIIPCYSPDTKKIQGSLFHLHTQSMLLYMVQILPAVTFPTHACSPAV